MVDSWWDLIGAIIAFDNSKGCVLVSVGMIPQNTDVVDGNLNDLYASQVRT